jgi:signal peptidase I
MQSLGVTVVIAIFVITFIVQAFQIPSESMENTLLIGDYLLVDKVHYASGGIWGHILPYSPIRRGDIIVFRFPVDPTQHFVKRVIGVPGDHIHMKDKVVYVNGKPLNEPYVVFHAPIPDPYRDDFPAPNYISANMEAHWWLEMRKVVKDGELVVPPGQYFVMGDNRDESLDSRYWGFVPRTNIVGRPLVIYWSFDRDDAGVGESVPNGKLNHLEAVFSRLFHDTRWDRTLRLVR